MDRVVIDAEGRVSEPLGCGDDQIVVALIGVANQGLVRVLGLLAETVKSVAALKLLQPAPLCPDRRRAFTGIGSIWAATGVGP